MKKVFLLLFFSSQIFANQSFIKLDLSSKKIHPSKEESKNFSDKEQEEADFAWDLARKFLLSFGRELGDFSSYQNITNELLELKLSSIDFDYSTLTKESIFYKINYSLNFSYKNYEYKAKKFINELQKLKTIKIEKESFSQNAFIALLNGSKTVDVKDFASYEKSFIFIFLKNGKDYELYKFSLPIEEKLYLNSEFFKNKLLNPDEEYNAKHFLALENFAVDKIIDEFSEDNSEQSQEYFLNNYAILAGSFSKIFGNLTKDLSNNNNLVIFPYFLKVAQKNFSTYEASKDMTTIKGYLLGKYSFDDEAENSFFKKGGGEIDVNIFLAPTWEYSR